MKVFLSLPMSGKSDEEIKNDLTYMRKIIFEHPEIFGNDAIVTDNFKNEKRVNQIIKDIGQEPKNGALAYLGVAISEMSECDAVLFHPSYNKARGCRVERYVSIEYDLERYYITDDNRIYKQGEGFIS